MPAVLLTTPSFDGLVRHPQLLSVIDGLFGTPACFSEIELRQMGPQKFQSAAESFLCKLYIVANGVYLWNEEGKRLQT